MEILPWTPLQLFATHNFLPCSLFAHILFFSWTTIFPHIRTNFFLTHSSSSFSSQKHIRSSLVSVKNTCPPSITPPWACSLCPMEVLKSFPPINGLLILHEPMKIDDDFFPPMEFWMRISHAQWNTMKVPFLNQIWW